MLYIGPNLIKTYELHKQHNLHSRVNTRHTEFGVDLISAESRRGEF